MNLYLHGIGHELLESPIRVDDSLGGDPGTRFDLVLTGSLDPTDFQSFQTVFGAIFTVIIAGKGTNK